MLLGILNAIPNDPDRIRWDDHPVDAYVRFFELESPGFEYRGYDVIDGVFPESAQACDAYVITGSPRGVYDSDPWIQELAQFIRDAYAAGRRLIGICFGHQILAHALGGHAEKSERGYGFGLKGFDITVSKPWMEGESAGCSLYFVHQDQVIDLPPGAELLGGSDFCPNALYAIGDRAMGIQGHPEFTENIMQDLLGWYDGKMDESVYVAAVRSMAEGQPDNRTVAQWMVNFLTAPETGG